MDAELWALLTGSAAIADVCADRVYWGVAPQGARLPYLVLNIVSGADAPRLIGVDALWRYRVQADCYGDVRPAAQLLSAALISVLNGYGAANSTGIRGAFVAGTRDYSETAALDRPARISHDFIINWRGADA